jgi:hypothetical protein
MTPRRFRWHRFSAVLQFDPTGTVEILVGFCFLIIPGIFLAVGPSGLPGNAFWYFSQLGFTELRLGGLVIILGLLQIWGAATNWYAVRAWIAFGAQFSLVAIVVAYCRSGLAERWAVAYLVGTVFAEVYIAWRCWHERPDPLPVGQIGTSTDATTR